MAVHVIDEPDIEIGKPMTCGVVVNHHVELTEEEKNEQKAIALKLFQDEELLQVADSQLKTQGSKTAGEQATRIITLWR